MSDPSPAPVPARAEVVDLLLRSGAVRFGQFTLASGKTSDVYVDIKKAWTDPGRLRPLAAALSARVGDAERLAGMELGAVPLVVAVALSTGLPYVVVRKAAKAHGTQQRYEGEIPSGCRVLIIEDVTTTGGSVLETVEVVRAAGGRVARVLTVVDRESGAAPALGAAGVALESLVTLAELRGAHR
ncbi:MAG TPA: orotate phosphoribosyltransferase [Thermoplasmata archaeon]|nr:orotate phosphoribosyltransferase [Thermoplasmata archaeon]